MVRDLTKPHPASIREPLDLAFVELNEGPELFQFGAKERTADMGPRLIWPSRAEENLFHRYCYAPVLRDVQELRS